MNRAQGDSDPSGKSQEWDTAGVAINIAAIAAGMIMILVWTFFTAQAGTALVVVFVAALLMFIIPIVIIIVANAGHGGENLGH